MLKAVTVTNYLGNSLRINLRSPEESSGFVIEEITGLGPSKADINVTDIASNDGALYNSARLTTRNIVMKLRFMMQPTIEEVRLLSYKYFPIKKQLKLTFESDERTAYVTGFVESNEQNIFTDKAGCQISIICPDPYYYSNDVETTIFSGVEGGFEFAFSNESLTENLLEMGEIKRLTENTVYYQGDADTGVTLVLHALGTVDNPVIYNVQTRERMKIDTAKLEALTGQGMIAGDDITICTVKGQKSISLLRRGIKTNILNALDKNADWFQLSKGDNIFTYDAEYGASNLQFKVVNNIVFEGI